MGQDEKAGTFVLTTLPSGTMSSKNTECVKVSSRAVQPHNWGCKIHKWCLLQVVVRCRPFSEQENLDKRQQIVTVLPKEQQIQECHVHSSLQHSLSNCAQFSLLLLAGTATWKCRPRTAIYI